MGIIVGIVAEASPGERRVAMVPSALSVFNKTGVELLMEPGAGVAPAFPMPNTPRRACASRPAARKSSRTAEVILQVRAPGRQSRRPARRDLALMRQGQTVIGFGEPLTALDAARALAERGVTFSPWN